MIRTGIFGGSFNPIHNGHLNLARGIVAQGLADEVWLMVSPQNPLKKKSGLWDEEKRFKLAKAAVEGIPGVEASDFEFRLPRPSYMWRTLLELEQAFPNRGFSLIIGADNWKAFPQWAHFRDILSRYPVLIYPREGFPISREELPTNVRLIEAPLFPWSSTEIRNLLKAGKSIDGMLPEKVAGMLSEERSL